MPPDGEIEPGWLFVDPPRFPGLRQAGGLGDVQETIPPRPYARCFADRLISLSPAPDVERPGYASVVALAKPEITAWADPYGHVRVTVVLKATPAGSRSDLYTILREAITASITVRHPERRGTFSTLDGAANDIADYYGRETARTAPNPRAAYKLDWVVAGRPFLIVVAEARERLRVTGVTFDGPVLDKQFDGFIRFVPFESEDLFLPVWLLVSNRGGQCWKIVAEALETFMGHLEEFIVYLQLADSGALKPAADSNQSVLLRRYDEKRRGYLRRTKLAGMDQRLLLRLLTDYETTAKQAQVRQELGLDKLAFERVSDHLKGELTIGARAGGLMARIERMTINIGGTGNIVNLGEMIANTISTTNNMISDSKSSDEIKTSLEALRGPVTEAAANLPLDDARNLLDDYETFAKQALREKPNKEQIKSQGSAIVEMVSKVAGLATPIVGLVAAVVKLIV